MSQQEVVKYGLNLIGCRAEGVGQQSLVGCLAVTMHRCLDR